MGVVAYPSPFRNGIVFRYNGVFSMFGCGYNLRCAVKWFWKGDLLKRKDEK